MLKVGWLVARRWWPAKVVQVYDWKACKQTARLKVVETAILVDEPMPGFKEAIEAALAAREEA